MSDQQAYIDRQEAHRRELAAKIELLRARAARASADTRVAINEQIEKLARQEDKYAEKIGELKQSSGEAWTELKDGVEKAWDELKSGVKAAAEKFP